MSDEVGEGMERPMVGKLRNGGLELSERAMA